MDLMNVIMFPFSKQAHVIGAIKNKFYFVSLDLDDDFLKRTQLQKVRSDKDTKDFVKKKLATALIKL